MRLNVPIQIKVTEAMHTEFKELAEKNKDVPSQLIRKWIEEYVEENKGE